MEKFDCENLVKVVELNVEQAYFAKSTKEHSKKCFFEFLPGDLIEHEIFSYLDSRELFFNVRAVNTEWSNIMKNIWCSKIKQEMIDQVKTIDFVYEKEVITKTYEFKLEYLLNYRNLLSLYNNNTNIVSLIKSQMLEFSSNDEVVQLINLFFDFTSFNEAQEMILSGEYGLLDQYLANEQIVKIYKERFQAMISVDSFHEKNENQLLNFRNTFNLINKTNIEFISDSSRLIYALLQGLIEFEILKYELEKLKEQKKALIRKIQKTTNEWPKKKKFFERAYKIILYTK